MTKVIMPETLANTFMQMADSANKVQRLLLGHAFLTRKQKEAIEQLRAHLIAIVKANSRGEKPKEIAQEGEIAVEDHVRYRQALELIAHDPRIDPEGNARLAFGALYPKDDFTSVAESVTEPPDPLPEGVTRA